MRLIKHFLTKNECYKVCQKHQVEGLMLHSTGANNPYLSRYIDIKDEKFNPNNWNQYRPNNRQVCVHGFIGKLANGTIATYQTLPFNIVGWHSGKGINGSANFKGYLGFEICEDSLTDKVYFEKVYKEAVELFAYLCNEYSLNPLKNIICHCEGYELGIASNHADVMHWFPRFNKDMDTFRHDINEELKHLNNTSTPLYCVQVGAFKNKIGANNFALELKSKGYNAVIKQDKNEIIDMELITKQIEEEVRKKVGQEYEKKFNNYKDSLSVYVKESEW